MKHKPLVDESILDGIPDELIRPLLAISIRASRPQTIKSAKQLLKEIDRLGDVCRRAGGESLYYIRVRDMVRRRMYAMIHAQTWARKTDPTAEATSIEINRWSVEVHSAGRNQLLLVGYERAGVDRRRMEEKLRPVITEASEKDV